MRLLLLQAFYRFDRKMDRVWFNSGTSPVDIYHVYKHLARDSFSGLQVDGDWYLVIFKKVYRKLVV